ncbi:tetratricopeptide repeat protein [Nitratireductor sp. ZSWI3]|uniref:tetratricopeptide repeat protein n=1 Tax=Nitratireductor sp. ZSWI3 TaxID=2966359 RepID=UPI00214FD2C4|nr:tetratricopeptide repeat protein [Nitratireductor sp. ZSWI3]MCR4264823.1 hypothetical protein [Nitratireductor sp. ZSWI3]
MKLLHILGYLYGCHGQVKRGVAYLLLAIQLAPEDRGVLRTLAHLLIRSGEADKALATIERLERLGDGEQPLLALLKSKALMAAGEAAEARHSFRDFLAHYEADHRV